MKSTRNGQNHFIFVEKDEKVMETLTAYCMDNGIQNGKISGIGAVENIEMGAYDFSKKEYIKSSMNKIMELVSFQGNISLRFKIALYLSLLLAALLVLESKRF